MSALIAHAVIKVLVAALKADPALAAFTVTDRPARPGALPHIRVGPVAEEPWSTATSHGAQLSIALALTSRLGSFATLTQAADAIAALLETPLPIVGATSVVQRLANTRFHYEATHDLERASLTLELLIDLGDAA